MALTKLYAVSGYLSSYTFTISEPGLVIAWYGWSNSTEPSGVTLDGAPFPWGQHAGLLAQVDVQMGIVNAGTHTVEWPGISGYRTGVLVVGGIDQNNSVPPPNTYVLADTSSTAGTVSFADDGTFIVIATRFDGSPYFSGVSETLFSELRVAAGWRSTPGSVSWYHSGGNASIIAVSLVAQKAGGWVTFF